jgi:hypothetical protein
MYSGDRAKKYKYKRSDPTKRNAILLILFIGFAFFISSKSVEFFHRIINSQYYVSAEHKDDSMGNYSFRLFQDIPSKRIIDEEFFRAEHINTNDKRVYVLEKYFEHHNSPLKGQGINFVKACDKYGAPWDCISLVAIAKHETNLCKYHISAQMHNCLGWGGAGPYRITFNSFEDMINRATDVLVNSYGIERMDNPVLMEKVFCGPQDECIGWGRRVISIMNDINHFAEGLGVGKLREEGF